MALRIGLALVLCAVCLNATPIFKENTAVTRQLENIERVDNYKVELTLDEQFDTFQGSVEIKFKLKTKGKVIVLNAVGFVNAEMTSKDNYILTLPPPPQTTEEEMSSKHFARLTPANDEDVEVAGETITLNFDEEISADDFVTLKINKFSGKLSTDMKGFYKSTYEDKDGKTHNIALTQFEPIYARRAFPCFDDPSLKATFDFTITYPKDYSCLFNTKAKEPPTPVAEDEKYERVTFETTPIMSTYLVAFVISDFVPTKKEYTPATNPSKDAKCPDKMEFTVWTRKGDEGRAAFASEEALKVMGELEEFTGINYELCKMDQVAVPDFSAGAMENWGLATYRETALLFDETESSEKYRQRVSSVIAHEFSHMWFGDLVTLDWWSNTWLNEGFATYFEHYITGQLHKDWKMDEQFVLNEQQVVMIEDAMPNAKPLSSAEDKVQTIEQMNDKFTAISYNKGGSIIRMLEHIVGTDEFKPALHTYLDDNKHSNVNPTNLWEAFPEKEEGLPDKLEKIMTKWIDESGYPVLTVELDTEKKNFVVQQEQFLLTKEGTQKEEDPKGWYVPISYTTSKDLKFEDTAPKAWLKDDGNSVSIPQEENDYIILNIKGTGYYRVKYDKDLLTKIIDELKKEKTKITEINRAQLLDDAMNLARAGQIEYDAALSLTEYLVNEHDYVPWATALNNYNFLRMRFAQDPDVEPLITKQLNKLMEGIKSEVISKLKDTKSDHIDSLRRELIMQWACELGDKECTKKADELYTNYKKDKAQKNTISPELRSTVYCTVIRNDNKENENFIYFQEELKQSTLATETMTLITALGCSKDEEKLKTYLKESINTGDDSYIRPQDANYVFNAVLTGNSKGVDIALDFLTENWAKIKERYGGLNALSNIIMSVANRLTTEAQQTKFGTFLDGNKDELGDAAEQIDAAKALVEANLKWQKEKKANIQTYLKQSTTTTTTSTESSSSSTKSSSSPTDSSSSSTKSPSSSTDSSSSSTDATSTESTGGADTLSGALVAVIISYLCINIF